MAKLEPLTLSIPAGREDLSYEMHVRPAGAGWKITLDPVGAPAGNRSPVQPRPSNELDLFRPNGPRYRPLRKDPNMTRREPEEVIVGGMLASFVIPCLDENGE